LTKPSSFPLHQGSRRSFFGQVHAAEPERTRRPSGRWRGGVVHDGHFGTGLQQGLRNGVPQGAKAAGDHHHLPRQHRKRHDFVSLWLKL